VVIWKRGVQVRYAPSHAWIQAAPGDLCLCNGVRRFAIASDDVRWIDSAVIYEIRTETFTSARSFEAITAKIPEPASLGINTIWLQPIFPGEHVVHFNPEHLPSGIYFYRLEAESYLATKNMIVLR